MQQKSFGEVAVCKKFLVNVLKFDQIPSSAVLNCPPLSGNGTLRVQPHTVAQISQIQKHTNYDIQEDRQFFASQTGPAFTNLDN